MDRIEQYGIRKHGDYKNEVGKKGNLRWLSSRIFRKYVEQVAGRFGRKTGIRDIDVSMEECDEDSVISVFTVRGNDFNLLFTFTLDISEGASFCTGPDGEKYEDIMDRLVLSPFEEVTTKARNWRRK